MLYVDYESGFYVCTEPEHINMITAIIPARNEPYLQKTILDLLSKAKGEIEIIVVLDGYWMPANEIVEDPRVIYLHFSTAKGMRNAINSARAIAKGDYLMKLDAHCMFGEGYDEILKAECEDNWVVVPRRYALDPQKWQIEERTDNKYPIDYMYLSSELHGVVWDEKNHDLRLKEVLIDDTMSNQGSVWFMKKTYFDYLDLMDEANYGTFWVEFQEIGLKCWLSGGKVKVNKKTWYAHWHKNESRGYSLPSSEGLKAQEHVKKWLTQQNWRKQIYNVRWLVDKFAPVPTWNDNAEEVPSVETDGLAEIKKDGTREEQI